jgi:hypothetical protein
MQDLSFNEIDVISGGKLEFSTFAFDMGGILWAAGEISMGIPGGQIIGAELMFGAAVVSGAGAVANLAGY